MQVQYVSDVPSVQNVYIKTQETSSSAFFSFFKPKIADLKKSSKNLFFVEKTFLFGVVTDETASVLNLDQVSFFSFFFF